MTTYTVDRMKSAAYLLSRTGNSLVSLCPVSAEGRMEWDSLLAVIEAAPGLLAFARRVAFEPVGRADASHREVLDQLADEAKAILSRVEGQP